MKIGRWSQTAGNNNATPPDGWPEGQAPSTVNDCARENMAAIRTAFADLQYFDQDFTPTFISATSFSVPGNQTSAIHAGRRLKLFDTAVVYGTVATASFTVVTTINIAADAGSLTSSLSSFGLSVLSNDNNSIPRNLTLTASALTVNGPFNVSGASALNGTLTVSGATAILGAVRMDSTLSVSGTVVAANVAKAWVRFSASASVSILSQFNVGSVSRSAVGTYRINFTNAMPGITYAFNINAYDGGGGVRAIEHVNILAGSIKFRTHVHGGTVMDADVVCANFWNT